MVVLHFHAQIADALYSGDFQPEIEMYIEFKVVIRNDSFIVCCLKYKYEKFYKDPTR